MLAMDKSGKNFLAAIASRSAQKSLQLGTSVTLSANFVFQGSNKKNECFLQCCGSNFFGLESFDVKLGRDVGRCRANPRWSSLQLNLLQNSSRIWRTPESILEHINEADILSLIEIVFFKKKENHVASMDHQMEFQKFLYGDFPSAKKKNIPSLLSTTLRKDPTEPEERKYLLFSLRTAFSAIPLVSDRACSWLCRDSNTSLHKHASFPEKYLYEEWSDARMFANFSSYHAHSLFFAK